MVSKSLAIFAILYFAVNISAKEIPADTKLSSVLVYLGGAELTHNAKVNIPQGVHEIILENVADNFVNNSLQVGGEGDFVILSVASRKNYLKPEERSPRLAELKDSLKLLEDNLSKLNNKKQVLQYELELLLANKNFGGRDRGISVKELEAMGEYFNTKSAQLLGDMSSIDNDREKVNGRISKIQNQINEVTSRFKSAVQEIVVTVSAKQNTSAILEANYLTYEAGWNPSYDLRAADINSPVQLDFRANVWQRTGIDWNDMNISLSTRSARQNNNKPELRRWFVDFVRELKLHAGRGSEMELMKSAAAPTMDQAETAESMADYMMVNETQLAVEYSPELNYSIPSDGKQHIVPLQNYELQADYEYYAAPKLISNAFLVANVTDWDQYNLLPGPANVYFENSYVGNSFINPNTTDDEMVFSMGRDEGIVITRETLKDFTEEKFFGSDVERFFGYEINVRNTKNKEIKLMLEDQVPISQHEDIDVELVENGGAEVNESTGILTWNIKLGSGESMTKKFTFSVRYPEDKPINIY